MSDVSEPSYRQRIGYQAGLLGGFATLAATLLVAGNLVTQGPIAENQRRDLIRSLERVIPAEIHDNQLLDAPLTVTGPAGQEMTVYRAIQGETVTGLAYKVAGNGYAGPIHIIMGVKRTGEVLGVRVLAHAETPGLGDKIEVERDDWILSFDGLRLGEPPESEWAVKKDGGRFDQFTGATITPRAVVNAVKDGLEFFEANKGQLLASEGGVEIERGD